MDPESAAPTADEPDDFTAWADQRIAAVFGDHLAYVERVRLVHAQAAIPSYAPPVPEPAPLMLRVPEHVWKRLIIELGRQRLEELLAADDAAVYRLAWGRFRARLRAGEFGS